MTGRVITVASIRQKQLLEKFTRWEHVSEKQMDSLLENLFAMRLFEDPGEKWGGKQEGKGVNSYFGHLSGPDSLSQMLFILPPS
jgi:hypothetical protein